MGFYLNLADDLVAVEYYEEVKSDIRLPDWKRSLIGRVIARGPGELLPSGDLVPMQTEVGNKVSFGAAVGMEAVANGYPIRIMKDKDIDFVFNG
jgi:co-chaperonin GroES (HSP10)